MNLGDRPHDLASPGRRWRCLARDERGAVAAELVIATPLLLLLIMGVIQFALWEHAEHIASAVAQQGVSVARLQGETAGAGQAEAHSVLDQLGPSVLSDANITATRTATTTTVIVDRACREHPRDLHPAGQSDRCRPHRDVHQCGRGAVIGRPLLRRLRRGGAGESGSVATELVLLTPLLILMLLFVVALGRLAGARLDVDGAAAQAARAASIARDPSTATAMAQQTATSALGSDGVTCGHLTVTTDTAQFAPGGSVTVTVTCSVGLSDLTGLRLPASESISSTSTSVIDTYRAAT